MSEPGGAAVVDALVAHGIRDAFVLLIIGSEVGDSDLWGGSIEPSGTVIRIDIDPAQLHKNLAADIVVEALPNLVSASTSSAAPDGWWTHQDAIEATDGGPWVEIQPRRCRATRWWPGKARR